MLWRVRSYFRNYCTNTRLVCTYLNTFCMLIPKYSNKDSKVWFFLKNFYLLNIKFGPDICTSLEWRWLNLLIDPQGHSHWKVVRDMPPSRPPFPCHFLTMEWPIMSSPFPAPETLLFFFFFFFNAFSSPIFASFAKFQLLRLKFWQKFVLRPQFQARKSVPETLLLKTCTEHSMQKEKSSPPSPWPAFAPVWNTWELLQALLQNRKELHVLLDL